MNIVINAILYHEKPRGVGTYLNNLLEELAKFDDKNIYYIYYGEWMKEYSFLNIKKYNFKFIKAKTSRNKIIRNLYQLIIFPFSVLKYKPAVIHIPDTSPLLLKTCNIVSTIHDVAEYVYPEKYGKFQALARKIIVRIQSKMSDRIITVSKFSRDNIINMFNLNENKVIDIYNGVDLSKYSIIHSFDVGNKYDIQKNKYFLFVGEIERTKNISIILKAMRSLESKEKIKLVICGKKGNDFDNVLKEIKEYKLDEKIVFTGYVSDKELKELYSNCYIFIFPSLFEGFGLPVLEAMASGAPVICSNASAIPEVGGNSVLKFNPKDEKDLLEKINLLFKNSDIRNNMIANGIERSKRFTWEKAAEETCSVYNSFS